MDELKCDWRLFSSSNKDCLVCEDYEHCRAQRIMNDPEYQHRLWMMTDGVVEDDAKEYSLFLKEWDKLNFDMLGLELDSENDEVVEEPKKLTKAFKELQPFMEFFDAENIPYVFQEPTDLYAANFMMLSYTSTGIAVRLASISGVPKGVKMMKQIYKSSFNKRQYKYTRKMDTASAISLVRSVVFYRKSNDSR